jgi:hypothetical protein
MKRFKVSIDRDASDEITVLNLKDYKTYLKKELKDHKNGGYLHPDDVTHNAKMIEAIDFVLRDYT